MRVRRYATFVTAIITLMIIIGPFWISPAISAENPDPCKTGGDIYCPLAPLPDAAPRTGTDFITYLKGIFKLGITLAIVLAIFMIVIGGIQYTTTDVISKKEDGLKRIQAAGWGLLLAIASWIIIYTINPDLLSFRSISPPRKQGRTTPPSAEVYNPNAPPVGVPYSGSYTNNPSLFPVGRR